MQLFFTRRSAKDGPSRVTIRYTSIEAWFKNLLGHLNAAGWLEPHMDELILNIKYRRKEYGVYFYKNSKDTFKTTSWPRELPLPEVGKHHSQSFEVTGIKVI